MRILGSKQDQIFLDILGELKAIKSEMRTWTTAMKRLQGDMTLPRQEVQTSQAITAREQHTAQSNNVGDAAATATIANDEEPTTQAELQNIKRQLHTLMLEMETLKAEMASLRQQAQMEPVVTVQALPPSIAVSDAAADRAAAQESPTHAVIRWLATRNISVRTYHQQSESDAVLDRLANHLGSHYEHLAFLYETIKRSLSTGQFDLDLTQRTLKEASHTTSLCMELQKQALLQNYKYHKSTKTIHAEIPKNGDVTNFFTGNWFERFVYLSICKMLNQEKLAYSSLRNVRAALPDGHSCEMDMVFLVHEQPLWIECKTGDVKEHINRYGKLRNIFGLPQGRALLVNLDMTDHRAVALSSVYGITVTGHLNVLHHVRIALGLPMVDNNVSSQPVPATNGSSVQPVLATNGSSAQPVPPVAKINLAKALNASNLRPLPEHRSTVLTEIIRLSHSMGRSTTLYEVKERLALQFEHIQLSRNQLQDIMNALVRSRCFVDADGNPVSSWNEPFSWLSDNTVAGLDADASIATCTLFSNTISSTLTPRRA